MAENRGTKLRRPIARVAGDNPPIDESDLDEPLSLAEEMAEEAERGIAPTKPTTATSRSSKAISTSPSCSG